MPHFFYGLTTSKQNSQKIGGCTPGLNFALEVVFKPVAALSRTNWGITHKVTTAKILGVLKNRLFLGCNTVHLFRCGKKVNIFRFIALRVAPQLLSGAFLFFMSFGTSPKYGAYKVPQFDFPDQILFADCQIKNLNHGNAAKY